MTTTPLIDHSSVMDDVTSNIQHPTLLSSLINSTSLTSTIPSVEFDHRNRWSQGHTFEKLPRFQLTNHNSFFFHPPQIWHIINTIPTLSHPRPRDVFSIKESRIGGHRNVVRNRLQPYTISSIILPHIFAIQEACLRGHSDFVRQSTIIFFIQRKEPFSPYQRIMIVGSLYPIHLKWASFSDKPSLLGI